MLASGQNPATDYQHQMPLVSLWSLSFLTSFILNFVIYQSRQAWNRFFIKKRDSQWITMWKDGVILVDFLFNFSMGSLLWQKCIFLNFFLFLFSEFKDTSSSVTLCQVGTWSWPWSMENVFLSKESHPYVSTLVSLL